MFHLYNQRYTTQNTIQNDAAELVYGDKDYKWSDTRI